jgi:O-antigen ligase
VDKHQKKTEGYETVTRSRWQPAVKPVMVDTPFNLRTSAPFNSSLPPSASSIDAAIVDPKTLLKRGHALSFALLFLFTIVLYARPSEFYPSALTNSLALIIGVVTLATFMITQISLEGTLTARPAEVNLALLFLLAGALSIPLAINPFTAWHEFSGVFIRCLVIFIVIVNVVRTEARFKGLLLVALVTAIWLSLGAIDDYRLGLTTVEGYRVRGRGGAIFGNPNDMALYLVSMVPLTLALGFNARSLIRKSIYFASAILIVAAIILTYSRAGFLGLIVALTFFAWRATPRRRGQVLLAGCFIAAILLIIFPSYAVRLASIFFPSLDPVGSSDARRGELFRSIYVALRHPLLGVGMGNYAPEMSYIGKVTHNSYTQVAAEMGIAALVLYTSFIVSPLRKLGQIARETFAARADSHFHYLAIGLQAALLAYMVSSFFASVAYYWNVYYLVGYAVCFRRIYESETGKVVVVEKRRAKEESPAPLSSVIQSGAATT